VDGRTSVIQRTLTVNYRDASLGIAGANVTSGSGAGYTTYTQDSFTGVPGATGTKTLYYMPNSGYVSASINSIASSNTDLATGTAGSGANAGQAWTLNYTIPSSNTSVTVTVNGSGVAATAATTLATAATTAPTQATAATTVPTQATKATVAPTQATAATTLATAATTRATNATVQPTEDAYFYYQVEDCSGNSWNAKATYTAARFTNHEAGIVPVGFDGNIATITRLLMSPETGDVVHLMYQTNETCEGGGGAEPIEGGGGGGGGAGEGEEGLREPGGREMENEL